MFGVEMWRAILATVLGGLIVLSVQEFVHRPSTPNISAQVDWVTVGAGLAPIDNRPVIETLTQLLTENFGLKDAREVVGRVMFSRLVDVYEVAVKNSDTKSSKPIELYVSGAALAFVQDHGAERLSRAVSMADGKGVKLGPLLPDQEVSIIVLADHVFAPFDRVTILHDGAKLPVELLRFSDPLIGWVNRNGVLGESMIFLGLAGLTLIVLLMIVGLTMSKSYELRARMTSRREVADTIRFLHYIQAKHPEKYPTNTAP